MVEIRYRKVCGNTKRFTIMLILSCYSRIYFCIGDKWYKLVLTLHETLCNSNEQLYRAYTHRYKQNIVLFFVITKKCSLFSCDNIEEGYNVITTIPYCEQAHFISWSFQKTSCPKALFLRGDIQRFLELFVLDKVSWCMPSMI